MQEPGEEPPQALPVCSLHKLVEDCGVVYIKDL
jgi:hypothetical protein